MISNHKDWTVYRINLQLGVADKVPALAKTYEEELEYCNNLNRSAAIYGCVYYIDKNQV
jgi:hypothetical protein